jgi:hypothetical protein
MKLHLEAAPWAANTPSEELLEAVDIAARSVWRDAATDFYVTREARRLAGRPQPKGAQLFLNGVLDERFATAGWDGLEGRYRKGSTWVRITFRHQMSLGSDLLDALRLAGREGVRHLAICAATLPFLRLISPNDAGALVSYEKLTAQVSELDGVLDLPLFIGRLTPISVLPEEVSRSLHMPRPRDSYVPSS